MIVVDVETTGLDYRKNSIVSLGAVYLKAQKNKFDVIDEFYGECRIFDGAEIQKEALERNGFTVEQITNPIKVSLEQLMKKFLYFLSIIEDKTLAGENPDFDRDFIKSSFERFGILYEFNLKRINDLHSLSYSHHIKFGIDIPQKNGASGLNLDKTLNYVGLPDEPKPHNGLTGAKMEAEAFSRLIYGKPLFEEFKKFEVPYYLK